MSGFESFVVIVGFALLVVANWILVFHRDFAWRFRQSIEPKLDEKSREHWEKQGSYMGCFSLVALVIVAILVLSRLMSQ